MYQYVDHTISSFTAPINTIHWKQDVNKLV